LLLLIRMPRCAIGANVAPGLTLWALGGVLLALLVELGVAPHIVARENLALWHRLGTAMYAGQWVCALAVFAMLSRSAQRVAPPEEPQPGV
jgi:hypothetical protein